MKKRTLFIAFIALLIFSDGTLYAQIKGGGDIQPDSPGNESGIGPTDPGFFVMGWTGGSAGGTYYFPDVPEGWQLCDGTNGTPDYRDRFLVGATDNFTDNSVDFNPGDYGGSATMDLASNFNYSGLTGDAPGHVFDDTNYIVGNGVDPFINYSASMAPHYFSLWWICAENPFLIDGGGSTTTPTSGPNFQEWLFVASVLIYFVSLMSWRFIFRPVKDLQ